MICPKLQNDPVAESHGGVNKRDSIPALYREDRH